MKNWKTTSAGIALIAGAVVTVFFSAKNGNLTPEVITGAIASILAGVGFLVSKDNNVTGGTVAQ